MAQQHATAEGVLRDATAHTVLATTDLARARQFWEGTCGLTVRAIDPVGMWLESGGSSIYVYQRAAAPRSSSTVCGFTVPDLEGVVATMRQNGVVFEEYDLPGATTADGITSSDDGSWRSAWFKDPDGNICALASRWPTA